MPRRLRLTAYIAPGSSSASIAGRMPAEVCFISFFEGTAVSSIGTTRAEFVDVVATMSAVTGLVYRQISYSILSWSVYFGGTRGYDGTCDVESRCFFQCTELAIALLRQIVAYGAVRGRKSMRVTTMDENRTVIRGEMYWLVPYYAHYIITKLEKVWWVSAAVFHPIELD